MVLERRVRGTELEGGRVTYRPRRPDGQIRLVCKKAVFVDNERPPANTGGC